MTSTGVLIDPPSVELIQLDTKDRAIVWSLCGIYGVLTVAPFYKIFRICLKNPESGITIEKMFLFFCVGASLLRTIFFGIIVLLNISNFFLSIEDEPAFLLLSNLPRVVFFSTFCLLILFWAEIVHRVKYHQQKSFSKKRNIFIAANFSVYVIQGVFWFLLLYRPATNLKQGINVPLVENVFFSVLSIVVAFLFLLYGGRLFFLLKAYPVSSPDLQRRLVEVTSMTIICTLSFLIRGVLLSITSFVTSVDSNTYIVLLYCLCSEIIPCALVIAILSRPEGPPIEGSTDSKIPSSTDGSWNGGNVSPSAAVGSLVNNMENASDE